jgi:hypothetical protein
MFFNIIAIDVNPLFKPIVYHRLNTVAKSSPMMDLMTNSHIFFRLS